ncbi:MAG: tetratricopeptide repeat protein [Myxococcales bacterium]|nr:tetratricopeptide repeat protein [Myxococcales bacterium]
MVASRVLAVTVVLGLTGVAVASPAAEQLFQEGRKLLGQGKLAEACDAFRRSAELEPRAGTLLNLGDCEEKRGRTATAWAAFTGARAVAKRTNDTPYIVEAEKRVKKLEKKLPYLAIEVSAGAKAQGVVVQRGGEEVPAAELDKEVPIDPGRYEIAATAKDKLRWSASIDIVTGKHEKVVVPELAPDPSAAKTIEPGPTTGGTVAVVEPGGTTQPPTEGTTTPPSGGTIIAQPAPPPKDMKGRHLGLGGVVGASTDGDPLVGIRVPIRLGPLGSGSLRLLPSLLYTHIQDPGDNSHNQELFAAGVALEYVAPLSRRFAIAAGAGIGMDFIDDSYETQVLTQGWAAARLSPTFRLPSVDVGLHFQLVGTKDNVVGLAELGVDYFFW